MEEIATEARQIELGEITVDVILKDIKNVHLSVHPPDGRVSISAPRRTSLDTLRVYAVSKLGWIKKQRAALRGQERETPRRFVERESHYVWGRRYLMSVIERQARPGVEYRHRRIFLYVRPGADLEKRRAIVERWYRERLKAAVPPLIERFEKVLGVSVARFHVRWMKTKWGSCNPSVRSILLNTELAKKPRECLEYIVVHEMIHLLEPTHGERFVALMDRFLPRWRSHRRELNRLPVGHEEWTY